MNYVHGLYGYCSSIALERDGEVLVAAIYEPQHDTCYTAKLGGGAFCNGKKLAVSGTRRLDEALVAASFPPQVKRSSDEVLNFLDILETSRGVRRMGSAALNLSYVAAGQLDGFWATETHAWDIAAGLLIVREAGGIMTAMDGGPIDFDRPKFVAAATPELHAALRARLRPGTP
jgi:myo-inositol-1(or 4)-monophosphatase